MADPKESIQGSQTQESERASNTIITRDVGQEVTIVPQPPLFGSFASSEPGSHFESIVDRWIPLEPITVTTSQQVHTIVAQYALPEFLYKHFQDSVMLMPFTSFLYSELDFDFRFMINANKFHCGRLVASFRNDCYGFEKIHDSATSALTRPHVLIDLAVNAEGVLKIPFDYHRAFVRNVCV